MNAPRIALLSLAAGAALAACVADPVYQAPYALFTTDQASASSDVRRAATTIKVDGTELAARDSLPVKPGLRTVQLALGGTSRTASTQLTVDAKPCTRYIMIATRSSPTDDDWKPEVSRAEPIGECTSKFGNY